MNAISSRATADTILNFKVIEAPITSDIECLVWKRVSLSFGCFSEQLRRRHGFSAAAKQKEHQQEDRELPTLRGGGEPFPTRGFFHRFVEINAMVLSGPIF